MLCNLMMHPLIWKNDYQLLSICHHCNIVIVLFDTDLILETLYHSELPYPPHVVVSGLYFCEEKIGFDSLPLKLMEKNTLIPVLWAYILHWWKSATITKVDKAVFTLFLQVDNLYLIILYLCQSESMTLWSIICFYWRSYSSWHIVKGRAY